MSDVFLYQGDANQTDITLSDPTVLRGGGTNAEALPEGVQAVASIGTAVGSGEAVVDASGIAASSAVGSAVASGLASATPAGVSALALSGDPVASGAAVAVLAGVEAAAVVGQPVATGNALALPAGVETASAVGQPIATGDSAAGEAFPAGVESIAAIGVATVTTGTAPMSMPLFGVGGRLLPMPTQHTADVSIAAVAYPAGVQMRAEVGQPICQGASAAAPAGVAATTASGPVTATGIQNLEDDEWACLLQEAA
jgi:hypothetical protein